MSGSLSKERRRTVRYPFNGWAELIDEASQTRLSTRVTALSLYGCYCDTTSPFPPGTRLLIKIASGLVFFEAHATVVYSQDALGMGGSFNKVHPYFLKVLHGWLRAAEKERQQVGSATR